MAVTWTPYPDGYSLTTLRTNINTFNSAVQTNIGTIETNITNLGTNKVSVADTGIVYVVDGTMPSASLTTSYAKVGMVNTTAVNEANSHITVDNVLYTYTVNTTGIYRINFCGAMTAHNGSIVTFNYNVNGVSHIANPPQFVGGGSRVVQIQNSSLFSLTAGAVIYIEAKADSSITMTPVNCGFMIEKTHY